MTLPHDIPWQLLHRPIMCEQCRCHPEQTRASSGGFQLVCPLCGTSSERDQAYWNALAHETDNLHNRTHISTPDMQGRRMASNLPLMTAPAFVFA